jgi:drug/metabolite transporter (DMT)-like permease
MPPLLFAGVRFLIAGALLCAWRLPIAIREGKLPSLEHWRRTLLIGSPAQGTTSLVGLIIVVVASLSWAAGSLYSRSAKLPDDSFLATGMEMLMGGVCLVVAAFVAGEYARVDVAAISPASWIALVYLIFFGGIVGFSAYLWVIRNAPTALVSTYAYVNPVVAVILGWAVLHESLTLRSGIAGAIVIASVAWIVSSRE